MVSLFLFCILLIFSTSDGFMKVGRKRAMHIRGEIRVNKDENRQFGDKSRNVLVADELNSFMDALNKLKRNAKERAGSLLGWNISVLKDAENEK